MEINPRFFRWLALGWLLASTLFAPSGAEAAECTEVSVHCGAAPTVVFGPSGWLWVAFAQEGHVYVTHSLDRGATFAPPVQVNPQPERVETNGENRPKIAFSRGGLIYVSWTRKTEGRFTGDVRFSRSLDGGKHFETVRTVNDDGRVTGHRFESLHVDTQGDIYLAWIDKRDRDAARARGEKYRGAALYYTVSTDGGANFAVNRRVADFACECCRVAFADAPGGGAAVIWRHIFDPNIRDHAFAVLGAGGVTSPMRRTSEDGWKIDACPHHGPAIVPAEQGGYHTAWFTAPGGEPAVYYGRFDPTSGEMLDQVQVSTSARAHPNVVAVDSSLHLVWKEEAGEETQVHLKTSHDAGSSWGEGEVIARTVGRSDHPFLISDGRRSYLAWHTAAEGLRVVRLGE